MPRSSSIRHAAARVRPRRSLARLARLARLTHLACMALAAGLLAAGAGGPVGCGNGPSKLAPTGVTDDGNAVNPADGGATDPDDGVGPDPDAPDVPDVPVVASH